MDAEIKPQFSDADLRQLIIPLVLEQFLMTVISLCNSLLVTHVGETAMSGVSLAESALLLLTYTFSALATGGAIVVGQRLGRGEINEAKQAGQQLIFFTGALVVAITLICFYGRYPLLTGLFGKTETEVFDYAMTYYVVALFSVPFYAVYCACAALFRIMGAARITMWVSLLMAALNLAGNILLIFVANMGVLGVAVSSIVSRVTVALIMLVLLRRPGICLRIDSFDIRPDYPTIRKIIRYAVPNSFDNAMFQMGRLLLVSMVSPLGTAAVSANAIASTVTSFHCIAGTAIGQAMVTVVSRCAGMNDKRQVRHYTKKLLGYTYLCMGVTASIILLLLPRILSVYDVSVETVNYAQKVIWIHCGLGIVLWPSSFTLPQALRAVGDMRFVTIVSMACMWLIRVGFAGVAVRYFGGTVVTVWLIMAGDWFVRTFCYSLRFYRNKWQAHLN